MSLSNKQERMKRIWSEGKQVPPEKCKGRKREMKFTKEAKPPIYTITKPHHKKNMRKARDKWDEQRTERTGRLKDFPLACTMPRKAEGV